MADKKDTSSGERNFPGIDTQKPKRTTATLELEATEIKKQESGKSDNESGKSTKEDDTGFAGTDYAFIKIFQNGNLLSGISGGAVVLFFLWLLNISGFFTTHSDDAGAIEILSSRLDMIDARMKKELKEEATNSFQIYQEKLNQLDKKIAAIAGSAKDKDGSIAEAAAITNLLTEIETNFDKKLSSLRDQLEVQMNEKLKKSSDELRRIIPLGASATGEPNADIVRRLVGESTSDLNKAVEQGSKDITKLNEVNLKVGSAVRSNTEVIQDLNKRVQIIIKEISELRNGAVDKANVSRAIEPVSERVVLLEKRLANIHRDSSLQKLEAKSTGLALAFTGLKRAADRGERFDAEFEAFRNLSPDNEELKLLGSFPSKGVPTLRELEDSFGPLVTSVLKADAEPLTASLWDKFAVNAASVIRFRRTGNIPGDTTEAILARMEFNIKKGDYKQALQESAGLKGAARTEASAWLEKLDARLKLDDVLQKIELGLLSEFGSAKNSNRREVH